MKIRIERNDCGSPSIFLGKHYLVITEYNDNKFGIMFQKGDKIEILLNGTTNDRPFIIITKKNDERI